jgi:peptidyl-prolyl cis-trans isomerase A (cyclophilin A)
MIFRTSHLPSTCLATTLILSSSVLFAQTTPATPVPDAPAPAAQLPDSPGQSSPLRPAPLPNGPTVLFDTSMGRMTCKFFQKESPLAVNNFIGLAQGTKDWTDPVTQKKMHNVRFYDGTIFHRVIPGFMIQGGDHAGDGSGDAGYFFDNESTPGLNFDVPGRLAMANAGPNTNGTQFFITELPQPDLDGKYTIFGQCDPHSVLIAASIARVDRNSSDKPYTPVVLNKVAIIPEGQPIPPDPNAPAASPSTAAPSTAPPK